MILDFRDSSNKAWLSWHHFLSLRQPSQPPQTHHRCQQFIRLCSATVSIETSLWQLMFRTFLLLDKIAGFQCFLTWSFINYCDLESWDGIMGLKWKHVGRDLVKSSLLFGSWVAKGGICELNLLSWQNYFEVALFIFQVEISCQQSPNFM